MQLGYREQEIIKRRIKVHKNKKHYDHISSRFTDYGPNVRAWKNFFNLPYVTKDDVILDFGCAVGFSILVGRELGYEVWGVDVEYKGPYKGVDIYREKYGTDKYIKIYDGYNLPFEDDTFTIIAGRTSFEKFNSDKRNDDPETISKMINQRLKEFDRITTGKKIIVSNTDVFITPKMWESYGFDPKIIRFRG